MLDEGVQIMRQAWTEGRATLDGKHYQVDGAIVRPLPLQEGGIPLWIAGGGEKVTLKIAARYARYTNFDGTLEGFTRKSEILAQHCRDLGTDFDGKVRSANYNVAIWATESEVEDRLQELKARPTSRRRRPRRSSAGTAGCPPAARRTRSWRTCASSRPPA
jgi:alkanesulfonate monooxygenase SsuD/methylene tetrahydromethanopterin reductase-like flavin-dependent oxidoreductase (luciferase family)